MENGELKRKANLITTNVRFVDLINHHFWNLENMLFALNVVLICEAIMTNTVFYIITIAYIALMGFTGLYIQIEGEIMANKSFVTSLHNARNKGLQDGFTASNYLTLLAMYNANAELDYLTDEQFKILFVAMEEEANRIFTEEYKNDPQNLAEVAVYHINELRKKVGLETV